jgi:hypothetical protein
MARISLQGFLPGHEGEVQQALANADQNFQELYRIVNDIPQGRLTLASNTPVMTVPVTQATNIYYTPYIGQGIPIFDGANFVMSDTGGQLVNVTTDAITNPAAAAANSIYDLFVWLNNGVPTLSRGPAWTNSTTRSAGTALTRIRGILVNNAAITNGPAQYQGTYVGTFATNTGTATVTMAFGSPASGGGQAFLSVWNMYNRVTTIVRVTDTQVPYTYTTATVRQAGGSGTNNIIYVTGIAEDFPTFYYQTSVTTAVAAGATCQVSIGDNNATAFELGGTIFAALAAIAATGTLDVVYTKGSTEGVIGKYTTFALELGDGLNANTFNVGSAGELSGILRM